ncbi:MAG: hypothetical protein HC786_09935 [Richelia sp. CSU_2_1]|nr:hypothetical protein [Richelia sp. CSU_2_1]
MSSPSIEGGLLLHGIDCFGTIEGLCIPPCQVSQEGCSIGVRSIIAIVNTSKNSFPVSIQPSAISYQL